MAKQVASWQPVRKDGKLCIHIRTDRKEHSYQARLWLPPERRTTPKNPYAMKDLDTLDREEAISRALEWAADQESKAKRGEPVRPVLFEDLADEWLTHLESRTKINRKSGRPDATAWYLHRATVIVSTYLKPYFGGTPVHEITQAQLSAYWPWRRDFWITGEGAGTSKIAYERHGKVITAKRAERGLPPPSTLNKDAATFNTIIKWSHEARKPQIVYKLLPRLSYKKTAQEKDAEQAGAHRRPHFTDRQWEKLLEVAIEGMRPLPEDKKKELFAPFGRFKGARKNAPEARAAKERAAREIARYASTPTILWQRRILYLLIRIMGGTGFRTSEAMVMRWFNIVEPDDRPRGTFEFVIYGSTPGLKSQGHARHVVMTDDGQTALRELKRLYKDAGLALKEGDSLWLDRGGKPLKSLRKAFLGLLDRAGIRAPDGKRYSLSSIRHTYATHILQHGLIKEGEPFEVLAKQLGNSRAMTEKQYSHVDHRLRAEDLRQNRRLRGCGA